MLIDAGYDRLWARFMHAVATPPPQDVQMLGVEMNAAREGPTCSPMDWDLSFAEITKKGAGASEVDGDTDSPQGSVVERIYVIPTTRPRLIRAVYGDSLRTMSSKRRNVRYDPGMSEEHGALLIPLTEADVRHSQEGTIAPLYDGTTVSRQYGTVAYTVAVSPYAHEIHDLEAPTLEE
eukprot:2457674-Pyramimonas_sp.AAC.1